MYKYLLLTCLLMLSVTVMVESQDTPQIAPTKIPWSQGMQGTPSPSGVPVILGTQGPSGNANTAQPEVASTSPVRRNPFLDLYQRQLLVNALFGLDFNDYLMWHYFSGGMI